ELVRIQGIEWVRVHYTHPKTWSEALIQVFEEEVKICKYVDIPLQHVTDSMLRRMRREVRRADMERLIETLRSRIPGVAIRTHFIVGFPGETEEDFTELLGYVRGAELDHVGCFAYSREDGTPAGRMKEQIPERLKLSRRQALMTAQKKVATSVWGRWVGRTVPVLVDGPVAGRHGPPPGRGPAPRTRGAHRDPRSRGHAGISRAAGRGAAAARRRRGAPHALAREGGPRHGGGGDRGTARRLHGRPAEPRRPKRRRFLRARAPEIPGGHPRLPEARLHAGRRESRGPQHAPGALGEVRLRLEHGRGPERGPLVRAERLGRPQSGHSSLRRRAAPSRAVDRDRRRHRARRSLLF